MKTSLAVSCVAAYWVAANAVAAEPTYRKEIKPLFESKCLGCHGASSPTLGEFLENPKKFEAAMKGPRLDTYADVIMLVGWPDTGAIMRRLDDGAGAGGKPGNMYQYLGTTEEERQKNLDTVKAWVGPEGWILKRWQARGSVPAISKEELDRIRVRY